jgi:hypothetical protein
MASATRSMIEASLLFESSNSHFIRISFLEHTMIFDFHLGTTLLLAALLERSGVATATTFGNNCAKDQLAYDIAPNKNGLADGKVDVLIIGSGWAGIGAGREIQLHNSQGGNEISYIILEAAGISGGRANAAH